MPGGDRHNADEALIAAIASGSRIEDAARELGVSEATIYRRLRDPDFKKRVSEARGQMVCQAVGRIAQASTAATTTLVELLGDPTPPAVRLGAARSILELGVKLRESEEFENRITQLEQTVAEQATG